MAACHHPVLGGTVACLGNHNQSDGTLSPSPLLQSLAIPAARRSRRALVTIRRHSGPISTALPFPVHSLSSLSEFSGPGVSTYRRSVSRGLIRVNVHSKLERARAPPSEERPFASAGENREEIAVRNRGGELAAREPAVPGIEEGELRQYFLERIGLRAREGDKDGAEEAFAEMRLLGLDPGPRAHHAVVVAFTRAGDTEGATQKLQWAMAMGQVPLLETFTAVIAALARQGAAVRAEDVMAWVEKTGHDSRLPWIMLVDELLSAGCLDEANRVFFKGAEGGLPASQALFDRMIQVNAERDWEHYGAAMHCLRLMEQYQLPALTYHWNFLLQAHARKSENDAKARQQTIFFFEELAEGPPRMWPNADSYHILAQALIRNNYAASLNEPLEVLGDMLRDVRMPQPHVKTYALFVEAFIVHGRTNEALRYLRAFLRLGPPNQNGLHLLAHDNGSGNDPLSLLIRLLTCEGRIETLLWLLGEMQAQGLPLNARALILQRTRHRRLNRSLVSAWLEPVSQEADFGHAVDHMRDFHNRIEREKQGLPVSTPFWALSDEEQAAEMENPDQAGFHSGLAPRQRSWAAWLRHLQTERQYELLQALVRNGQEMMGEGGNPAWLKRILVRLRRDIAGSGMAPKLRKPKAASKMLVAELRDELRGYNLPEEGTRPQLYQRVQKARRQARMRGEELWVPVAEEEAAEAPLWELSALKEATRVEGEEGVEWWAPSTEEEQWLQYLRKVIPLDEQKYRKKKGDDTMFRDPETGELRSEVELEVETLCKGISEENVADMRATFEMSEEERRQQAEGAAWWDFRYWGIADALGWVWEDDEREEATNGPIESYNSRKELDLALQLYAKVKEMGGVPTREDLCFLIRAAINTRQPATAADLFEAAFNNYGYTYGELLYKSAAELCVLFEDLATASRVLVQMHENAKIDVPEDLLQSVLALQGVNRAGARSEEPAGT